MANLKMDPSVEPRQRRLFRSRGDRRDRLDGGRDDGVNLVEVEEVERTTGFEPEILTLAR